MLKVYTILEYEEWDEIIGNNLIYYTINYCKAFEEHGNGDPVLFYIQKNKTIAYQVMFKRKINTELGEFYDLISPYGYGGWIINGEYDSSIFDEYFKYCQENNIVCEFQRFDLFRTDISKYYGNIKYISHNIVKRVDMEEQKIFDSMERRVRKNVRKAMKNNLEIIVDDSFDYIDEFKKIYYATMNRNNASDSYYFNDDFFNILTKANCKLFHITYEGMIISTELVLYDKSCCYSYLGGTINEYFYLRPNEIMKYEIMKWGHKKGLKYFVLGGGHGFDDGIYTYKKGLAPNGVYNFFVGNKIFDMEAYERLCKESKVDMNSEFFPIYRGNIE